MILHPERFLTVEETRTKKPMASKKNPNIFAMKAASMRSNLSPHVIRIWEKRYQAVTPQRTDTKRRLYSEEDVERLILLRKAIDAGHRIGQIARLSREELLKLIPPTQRFPEPEGTLSTGDDLPPVTVDDLVGAVKNFDDLTLSESLYRAAVTLSRPHLIEKIVVPFIVRVVDMWHKGTLRVAHELLATSVMRSFLASINETSTLPKSAPCIVVTTPAGQIHELGALIAATTALTVGWRALYFGPNLPTEEICAAAEQNKALAVALSIVYPANDAHVIQEFVKLRRLLPARLPIIVGGRSAGSYKTVLEEINAIVLPDANSLRDCLGELSESAN